MTSAVGYTKTLGVGVPTGVTVTDGSGVAVVVAVAPAVEPPLETAVACGAVVGTAVGSAVASASASPGTGSSVGGKKFDAASEAVGSGTTVGSGATVGWTNGVDVAKGNGVNSWLASSLPPQPTKAIMPIVSPAASFALEILVTTRLPSLTRTANHPNCLTQLDGGIRSKRSWPLVP